jgi:hypothetical protein
VAFVICRRDAADHDIACRTSARRDSCSCGYPGGVRSACHPLVEESEKIDPKAATEMATTGAGSIPDTVALLHGQMKADAKERVMRAFAAESSRSSCRRR